jgi:hypothetical protein
LIGLTFDVKLRAILVMFILLLYFPFSVEVGESPLNPMLFLDAEEMWRFCLELEALTLNHSLSSYSYRSAGSPGAQASADWIVDKMRSFGLTVRVEEFRFPAWEIRDEPSLTLYAGSQPVRLETFTPSHLSWPTPEDGLIGDLVVYPGGGAQVNESILIVGVDDLILNRMGGNLSDSIRADRPRAVLYTYFNPSNMWMPPILNSAEGMDLWNIRAPSGWIKYGDWIKIKEAQRRGGAKAEIRVPARIGCGLHRNIIGELPGANPDKLLMVTAHYDTVMSPGFIDDGSGVAAVLAMAHAFAKAGEKGYTPPYGIRFILFTAEELGLIGSLYYRALHEDELGRILGVVNLDSIGGGRLKITWSPSLLDELAAEAAYELTVPSTGGVGFKPSHYGSPAPLPEQLNSRETRHYETGADHLTFEDPEAALQIAERRWGDLQISMDEATRSIPAITITSRPIFPYYLRTGEEPGWIHTPFDNSTTPGWADEERLESHVETGMLTILKAFQSASRNGDLNPHVKGEPGPDVEEMEEVEDVGSPWNALTGEMVFEDDSLWRGLGVISSQRVLPILILIAAFATLILLPKRGRNKNIL